MLHWYITTQKLKILMEWYHFESDSTLYMIMEWYHLPDFQALFEDMIMEWHHVRDFQALITLNLIPHCG